MIPSSHSPPLLTYLTSSTRAARRTAAARKGTGRLQGRTVLLGWNGEKDATKMVSLNDTRPGNDGNIMGISPG